MARRARIVGAYSEVGRIPGLNSLQLHARIANGTLKDAGIGFRDIDGLITVGSHSDRYSMHAMAVGEYLGLRELNYSDVVAVGGASAVAAVNRASILVEAGVCRAALILSADDLLSGMTRDRALRAMLDNRHPQYEAPYGPTTAAMYAVLANRYLWEHKLAPEVLSHAAVQSRQYARANQSGIAPDGDSFEDINESRLIASPLRLFHCAPIADGGGGVIVSSFAPQNDDPAVDIKGAGEGHTNAHLVYNPDPQGVSGALAARKAFEEAGVTAVDIDVALIYDAFASSVGQVIETLGLAANGRAFHSYAEGEFGIQGRLPINPHGGLLSGGHPGYAGGILHVVEAVRQLRHSAAVQVQEAGLGLVHGSGGILSTSAVAVLERR